MTTGRGTRLGWTLALALTSLTPPPAGAETGKAAAVPACTALANYRMLMRAAGNDARTAAALLADPKADHMGCAMVARDRITGFAEHVALDGRSYDCLALRATSLCHWVHAGAAAPPDVPAPAGKPAPDRARR